MNCNHKRREFLKTGLAASAALVTGGPGLFLGPDVAHAQSGPDLSIARGKRPSEITRAAVDALGGIGKFVKPGAKVVIKPNMSFARRPDEGCNTHPEVVAETAKMCVEAGASKVMVLDNVLHHADDCIKLSGIAAACQNIPKTTVHTVNTHRLFTQADVPDGSRIKRMEVMKDVLSADVLIAVPTGKSHSQAGVSLSMKGMMGLIWDRGTFHRSLDVSIVDMVTLLKPHLIVVDGTRILSDGGPSGPGKVIPMNLVIASADMVAADAQMVQLGKWYGRKFKPDQVRHIRLAAQRGLGRIDLSNLSIKEVKV